MLKREIVKQAKQELARRDFWHYCLYHDPDFFSKRPFLKQVADAFQKVHDGEIKSLSVSMPPRAGKSYITSLFAAWILAKNPTESVMRNTCTARLYQKFSYDTRAIIRSDKFKEVFPDVQLASDKQNLDGWSLTSSKQVGYFGAGVDGTIIGFGASAVAITDDLYTGMADALSPTVNAGVKQWKAGTHDSRLEKGCPIIDIGTRWSRNDVIGENMDAGKYDLSIVIAALDNNDRSFCEDVKSTNEYLKIRSDLQASNSTEIWLAEYQQQPAEVEGLLFRKSEMKFFTRSEMQEYIKDNPVQTVLAYIDPAEGGGDDLAMLAGHLCKGRVFITDVVFSKETVEVTTKKCAEVINRLKVKHTWCEKNGLGGGFIRDMRRLCGDDKILQAQSSTNKEIRIWDEYGFIQRYFYFLTDKEIVPGSEYDKFMRNLFSYLKGVTNQQDGAPDATAGLSRLIQKQTALQSLFK